MDRKSLDAFLKERGFEVDGGHHPHAYGNKFCDLYIGTGRPWDELCRLRDELADAGLTSAQMTSVTNPDHEDYGKPMVEIKSYWNE